MMVAISNRYKNLMTLDRIKAYLDSPSVAWARLVSDILSPPMVWGVLAFPIAFRDAPSHQQALLWALTYVVLVCLLPIVYVAMMVRRGKITDIHMQVREQRFRPFIVSLLCTTIAWWVLRFMGAPPVLPMFALFSLLQLGAIALITTVWQISLHAMSISSAVITMSVLYGFIPALLTVPLVVLVSAARLHLKRHTPAQVLAGAVLGIALPGIVLILMVG
jgi:hypothetical protein